MVPRAQQELLLRVVIVDSFILLSFVVAGVSEKPIPGWPLVICSCSLVASTDVLNLQVADTPQIGHIHRSQVADTR